MVGEANYIVPPVMVKDKRNCDCDGGGLYLMLAIRLAPVSEVATAIYNSTGRICPGTNFIMQKTIWPWGFYA
jgi:hypothetical protein